MFQFRPPLRPPPTEQEQRDRRIFFLIEGWYEHNDTPISIRIIAEKMGGLSTSAVHRSLTRLIESGYIRRSDDGVLRLTAKRWKD